MGGAVKAVSNAFSSPGRALEAVSTFGGSELMRKAPGAANVLDMPDKLLGFKQNGGMNPTIAGSTDDPKKTLALTGGAPLLANVAMGASVEDSLAGYFGASNYKDFYGNLSDDDKQLVDGVKNQLTSIQSNTNLRNQAVQQVVNDFPNIAKQAAQSQSDAKSKAGEEFDATTKGYIDQALQGTAAKYAANGGLSSGAMDAATARVGAEAGMQKLGYMNDQGNTAYDRSTQSGLGSWQARYNETNALRNFQNTMTQGAAGQGFSAVQNMLGRTQQTNLANAGFSNQQNMQNQQNQNQMFGAIGQLGGTALGAFLGGPAGAAVGGQVGKMATSSINTPSAPTQSGSPTFSNWA